MNDEEFMTILDQLKTYINSEKTFIENPFRMNEFRKTIKIAATLFPEAKIEVKDDPLQMGATILHIEDYDLDITETNNFRRTHQVCRQLGNLSVRKRKCMSCGSIQRRIRKNLITCKVPVSNNGNGDFSVCR